MNERSRRGPESGGAGRGTRCAGGAAPGDPVQGESQACPHQRHGQQRSHGEDQPSNAMFAACAKMLQMTIQRPPYRAAAAPDSRPDMTLEIESATTRTKTVV